MYTCIWTHAHAQVISTKYVCAKTSVPFAEAVWVVICPCRRVASLLQPPSLQGCNNILSCMVGFTQGISWHGIVFPEGPGPSWAHGVFGILHGPCKVKFGRETWSCWSIGPQRRNSPMILLVHWWVGGITKGQPTWQNYNKPPVNANGSPNARPTQQDFVQRRRYCDTRLH